MNVIGYGGLRLQAQLMPTCQRWVYHFCQYGVLVDKFGIGMRCPKCDRTGTKVLDSRQLNNYATIRRRRVCYLCDTRFTTYERIPKTNDDAVREYIRLVKDFERVNLKMRVFLRKYGETAAPNPGLTQQEKQWYLRSNNETI